jgi:hypothetical protein
LVIDPASLYRAFEQVTDERKAVMEALSAPLSPDSATAGETGRRKVNKWKSGLGQRKEKSASRSNSGLPKGFPVNSTSSQALAHRDGQEGAQAIAQVIVKARAEEKCGSEPSRLQAYEQGEETLIHTAMDGKTLRGTLHHRKDDQPSVHLLTLYECESGIVLTQETVTRLAK